MEPKKRKKLAQVYPIRLTHPDRHLKTLHVAIQCAELGARSRTVHLLTGLSSTQLAHLLRQPLPGQTRGRHPDSREWYHNANLLDRAEASMVVSLYQRFAAAEHVSPPQALITAYKQYLQSRQSEPRISFDRAFDLVANTIGRWITTKRSFELFICPVCKSHYLSGLGQVPTNNHDCPFCKLMERYHKNSCAAAFDPNPSIGQEVENLWLEQQGLSCGSTDKPESSC